MNGMCLLVYLTWKWYSKENEHNSFQVTISKATGKNVANSNDFFISLQTECTWPN